MLVENDNTLSTILGWVSIACWIVVYSPQVYENYSLQSGEGLSVVFVVIWLIGDICNLFGALAANLLPTVIYLAVYYTVCDLILLSQIYYYRRKNKSARPSVVGVSASPEETSPLLVSSEARSEATIPPGQTGALIARYLLALAFVFGVGIAAWWVSENMNWDEGTTKPPTGATAWMVQLLGWTSAVLYLGARFPQILKNIKTRCEGLSPALFFFAIFGNVTYAASICAKSLELPYLLTNAGWLAGSILTVFLDVIVLLQFFYYVGRR
ncbi:PQ-loop-domain-containing protein [Pluteus cervinus]|uniref:PQ-loop-domain-containing protein n=1 Tax=Pluteus cervinus TaxID=181527 RepID=A0ACD3BAA4_9AGAR|nr:PQ-loop-domain-containing protein [Pluteus cervinus]